MDQNGPKIVFFVSFLKFNPSDSADFAYLSSIVLSYNYNETGWKFWLKIRPNYFLNFSSLEIVDVAHLSSSLLCLSTTLRILVVMIFWASKFCCLQNYGF